MPEGDEAVITETSGTVGSQEVVSNTAPVVPVSAQPAVEKRSDDQARIRTLQSGMEQAKAQRDALTIEKATLLTQLDTLKTENNNQLTTNAEATRNAIARAETFETDNANLRKEVTRLNFILANPKLAPYASLIPATDDPEKLAEVARTITEARDRDIEAINTQVRSGASVPPASPARPSGTVTAESINQQLSEARLAGNTKLFNDLIKEFTAKIK